VRLRRVNETAGDSVALNDEDGLIVDAIKLAGVPETIVTLTA